MITSTMYTAHSYHTCVAITGRKRTLLIGLMKSGFLLICFNVSDPNLVYFSTEIGVTEINFEPSELHIDEIEKMTGIMYVSTCDYHPHVHQSKLAPT